MDADTAAPAARKRVGAGPRRAGNSEFDMSDDALAPRAPGNPWFDDASLQRLYRYAYALTGHEADAYDLLHTALERYLRARGPAPDSPLRFVRVMIRNAFVDELRRAGRAMMEPFDETVHPVDFDQRSLEESVVDSCELEWLWPRMTPLEREILYLWAVDGRSMSEVATELGLPRGTILSTVHRMRKRLSDSQVAPLGEALP